MAKTSSFGFSNTTASSGSGNKITCVKLQEQTNYGVVVDEPTECRITNTTAAVGRDELITRFNNPIKKVNTNLKIANPDKVQEGISYGVIVEAVLTTTDSVDATYRVDEPVVCTIQVRHPRSGNVSASNVLTLVSRAVSAFMGDYATYSTAEVDKLMRSALQPAPDFIA
jgi:hypothetical protein